MQFMFAGIDNVYLYLVSYPLPLFTHGTCIISITNTKIRENSFNQNVRKDTPAIFIFSTFLLILFTVLKVT